MDETQIFACLGFVIVAMFTGFMSGYYIGYDRAMHIKEQDPRKTEWYKWPSVKVLLDDQINDYELAREINNWLITHIDDRDFKIFVHDEESQMVYPMAVFYLRDRNIALKLSIKYNITYTKGF